MPNNNKLIKAKETSTNELLHKPGIAGVGIGKKIIDGIQTNQDAIMVFVQSKVSKETVNLQSNDLSMIPTEIEGIETDVFECGEIVKMAGLREKVRPIKPGFSVSHGKVSAGTIGGIFYDKDGDTVILSNFHVLTPDGKAKIGDLIYQPGTIDTTEDITDKGWIRPLDKLPYIATLKSHSNLSSTGVNTHDSAIAKIHPDLVRSGFIDIIYPQLGKPLSGFGTVDVNNNIYKLGRTTGFTTGKILSKSTTFKIPYDFGLATFNDCIISTAMSQGGDSGSIGINENMQAFGLLFAGSQKVTIYNPISHVVKHYGLQIIGNQTPQTSATSPQNQEIIRWHDLNWKIVTLDGKILLNNDRIVIKDNASHHSFIETSVINPKKVVAKIHTGTDKGVSWGPGVALVFPNGIMRINLRFNDAYGAYYNDNFNICLGKVRPNTTYTIIFKLENDMWRGYVEDDKAVKFEIISLPVMVLGGAPHTLRLGKMGENHGAQDYAPPNSGLEGDEGMCKIIFMTQF